MLNVRSSIITRKFKLEKKKNQTVVVGCSSGQMLYDHVMCRIISFSQYRPGSHSPSKLPAIFTLAAPRPLHQMFSVFSCYHRRNYVRHVLWESDLGNGCHLHSFKTENFPLPSTRNRSFLHLYYSRGTIFSFIAWVIKVFVQLIYLVSVQPSLVSLFPIPFCFRYASKQLVYHVICCRRLSHPGILSHYPAQGSIFILPGLPGLLRPALKAAVEGTSLCWLRLQKYIFSPLLLPHAVSVRESWNPQSGQGGHQACDKRDRSGQKMVSVSFFVLIILTDTAFVLFF